ncbi:Cationic amino acid transporter 4, vacuolar [Lamellibrachia satsuma]|nr:Cationic amino acid transporter 4, vacuolar [Lamellibrachia satsuma]
MAASSSYYSKRRIPLGTRVNFIVKSCVKSIVADAQAPGKWTHLESLVSVAATAVRRTCVNSTKFKHARIDLTDCVRRVLFIQSRCSCGKPWHANQRQHQHPGRRLHHRVLLHGRCRRNTHEGISAMSVRDRFRRSAQACCHRMCRRKRHQTDTSASDTQHYHSVYDLLNVGLGSVLAMAVYIVVAPVAVHLTGPAIVVSVILAAVAGVMSGTCFLEMKSSLSKTPGTAYEYTYYVMGEAAAFCVGWMSLLRHVTCASAAARMLSESTDCLLGGKMLNVTLEKIGDIRFLHSHVDPAAALIVMASVVMASTWLRVRSLYLLVALTNAGTVIVVVIMFGVGIADSRLHNWEAFGSFFPRGLNGVLAGAAVLFCAFTHPEPLLTSTDYDSRTTKSSAGVAVKLGHVVMVTVAMSLAGVVTLVSPAKWTNEATLTAAFDGRWFGYVIGATAFLALTPFLLKCYGRAVDSQEAMTLDGLLPGAVREASDTRRITVVAAFFVGGLATLTAAILSVVNLLQLLAFCTLGIHVFVCLSLVVVQHKPADQLGIKLKNRYIMPPTIGDTWRPTKTTVSYIAVFSSDYGATQLRNDDSYDATPDMTSPWQVSQTNAHMCQLERETSPSLSPPTSPSMSPTEQASTSSSDTDIDEVVDEYRESQRIRHRRHFRDSFPSIATYRYTVGATATLCACSVCAALVASRGGATDFRHPNALILSAIGLLAVTLAFAATIVAAMPTNRLPTSSTVRSRWTPLFCVSVQLVLITSLPAVVWLQAVCWIAVGAAIYAAYGVSHSRLAAGEQPDEHRMLLLASRVSSPTSDTVHSPGGATP